MPPISETALMVIDVQVGFEDPSWGPRNNPHAESNIACVIAHWRERRMPIVHVQHCSLLPDSPLRPNHPGNAFKEEARPKPGEWCVQKTVNSAFIGTGLEGTLKEKGVSRLVIVGLTTDHCVSTTTRMAANLGFQTILLSDATATFDRVGPDGTQYRAEDIHRIHLASLNGEFCEVRTTAALLAPSSEFGRLETS